MLNQKVIREKIFKALPELQKKYPIKRLALFGSVNREDFNPEKSDVDILVEFNGEVGYEFVELADELEQLLGLKVDLVSRGALKPPHWEYLKSRMQYV